MSWHLKSLGYVSGVFLLFGLSIRLDAGSYTANFSLNTASNDFHQYVQLGSLGASNSPDENALITWDTLRGSLNLMGKYNNRVSVVLVKGGDLDNGVWNGNTSASIKFFYEMGDGKIDDVGVGLALRQSDAGNLIGGYNTFPLYRLDFFTNTLQIVAQDQYDPLQWGPIIASASNIPTPSKEETVICTLNFSVQDVDGDVLLNGSILEGEKTLGSVKATIANLGSTHLTATNQVFKSGYIGIYGGDCGTMGSNRGVRITGFTVTPTAP